MTRTEALRICPECLKPMRLSRCPDHGVDTVEAAVDAPRRPLAL